VSLHPEQILNGLASYQTCASKVNPMVKNLSHDTAFFYVTYYLIMPVGLEEHTEIIVLQLDPQTSR
jgi:hypothetical protein